MTDHKDLPNIPNRDNLERQAQTIVSLEAEVAALKEALPELPPDELIWRFLFMVGAMAHTMALSDDVHRMSGGACDPGDVEGTIRRLVPFLCAGLSSPVTQLTTPEA